MKIGFKATLIACLFASYAAAEGISMGTHVGAGFVKFWDGDELNDFLGVGITGSLDMKLPISSAFSFHPAVALTFRSESKEYNDSNSYFGTTTLEFYQFNLEFPFLLQANLTDRIFLEMGPFIALNMKSDASWIIEIGGQDYALDATVNQKSVEAGLIFGGGFSITKKIDLGARFALGLTPLFKKVEDNAEEDIEEADVEEDNSVINAKSFTVYVGATFWFI